MTPDGRLQAKDTYMTNLRRGDIIMYRAGDLLWPDWDILGGLIKTLEGNTGTSRNPNIPGYGNGDYTHAAWVVSPPDPDALVIEVSDRPGIYRIEDGKTWPIFERIPGRWDEQKEITRKRLGSLMPVRVHATWPDVREETIDLENPHMEVWRMRRATHEIIEGCLKLAVDMLGYKYDLADFLTFGNLHLPGADICSEFITDLAYYSSMLIGTDYPICLTPDIAGNADKQKTPNDLINSGELFMIRHQGLREAA
jgi:hypothetical protein